jgi:hypothetical protein
MQLLPNSCFLTILHSSFLIEVMGSYQVHTGRVVWVARVKASRQGCGYINTTTPTPRTSGSIRRRAAAVAVAGTQPMFWQLQHNPQGLM